MSAGETKVKIGSEGGNTVKLLLQVSFPAVYPSTGVAHARHISLTEVLQDWTVADYGGTAASASLTLEDGAVKITKTAIPGEFQYFTIQ